MKKASFKKSIGKRENMKYDQINDEYTCYNDKKLKPIAITTRKSKSRYKSKIIIYECENCVDCQYELKCTKALGNRKMQVSKLFAEKRVRSLAK
ncbi:transposase [Clostridium cellulovorans]|uniref:transposase n=1 Tax=Clostridium cellulovorans TaxID=1493 RepID=UPI0001A971E2|nr:transposase [Clostridium cellulovorans]